jgi:hypothetical protein
MAAGIVLEDDRRPKFVLGELHRLQDAVVLQVFEKLKLTQRQPAGGVAGSSSVAAGRTG